MLSILTCRAYAPTGVTRHDDDDDDDDFNLYMYILTL